jgi:hypothetical protein
MRFTDTNLRYDIAEWFITFGAGQFLSFFTGSYSALDQTEKGSQASKWHQAKQLHVWSGAFWILQGSLARGYIRMEGWSENNYAPIHVYGTLLEWTTLRTAMMQLLIEPASGILKTSSLIFVSGKSAQKHPICLEFSIISIWFRVDLRTPWQQDLSLESTGWGPFLVWFRGGHTLSKCLQSNSNLGRLCITSCERKVWDFIL